MTGQGPIIILPDFRGGGAERVALDLVYEFDARGLLTDFIVMQAAGAFLDEARALGRPIAVLGCTRYRAVPRALWRHLRSGSLRPLLVFMWPLTVIVPFVALLAGYRGRVVVVEHGLIAPLVSGMAHRAALRAGYRLADARVAVSAGQARAIAAMAGLAGDAIEVIANPVRPMSAPDPAALARVEELWNGTPRDRRILSVGTLKPVKNHALLIAALALLRQQDARLMLLGQGGLEDELRQQADELSVADRIIFAGFAPDPGPYYNSAGVFALSSDSEAFGNVLVEALAAGLPVIATDCPTGPREVLAEGRYGRLVPPGDAAAMALALSVALDEVAASHSQDRSVAAARRARAAMYTPERAAQAYLRLLFPEKAAA